MLSFTPDVEQVLQWFALTHQLQVFGSVALWQRTTLPYAGGLNEQPAKLMEALTLVCQLRNALVLERVERRERRREQRRG